MPFSVKYASFEVLALVLTLAAYNIINWMSFTHTFLTSLWDWNSSQWGGGGVKLAMSKLCEKKNSAEKQKTSLKCKWIMCTWHDPCDETGVTVPQLFFHSLSPLSLERTVSQGKPVCSYRVCCAPLFCRSTCPPPH